MAKRKRAVYDYIIVAIVVVISVSLAAALYAGRAKVRKGNLLIQELSMMRSGIQTYQFMNHKSPQSLAELDTSTYQAGSSRLPYVERLPRDSSGRIVDPFGNPYAYDPKTAWVQSQTEGFERW